MAATTARGCVRCTSKLKTERVNDVEVDVCASCGGLWLDAGELERISKVEAPVLASLRKKLTGDWKPAPPNEDRSRCPACPGELVEIAFGPIKVDACKSCHGLFLDRGELDRAVKTFDGSTVRDLLVLAGEVVDG